MKKHAGILIALILLGGCFEPGTIETPPEDFDLVDPLENPVTGYYSNLALEMEGIFSGVAVIDLADMSETERQDYIDNLRSSNWRAREVIDSHRKFCKNQLNTEKLHMNLSNSKLESWEVTRNGDVIRIAYHTRNEILIMRDDLEEAGIDPDNFTSKEYQVKLPADHRGLKSRVGDACAEGYDSEEDLRDNNYFYYFNPDKPGCEIDLQPATFTLHSLLPQKITYPEYDRLTADDKITVAVFFGAAGHEEEVPSYDWGVREYNDFVRDLRNRGFSFQEELDPKGKRYQRTRSGITEIVDVVSPYDLNALNHDTDGLFKQALQTHEVIAYLGHSFYGSLNVLRDEEAYPQDTYQIIFMNSCWSYEYYTKQVFEKKVTPRDPQGWELADVVNNTEVSWFHHNADEARILLTNLFKGCETGGLDHHRRYDWAGIIKAMNKYALDDWWDHDKEHEIYGVSGVTSNCYDPRDPRRCECTDSCPTFGTGECVGNAVRTCGNHDVDPCTEWSEPVPCRENETCQDGVCQPDCLDDGYEDNDQAEFAVGVALDREIELMSCPGDADWYQFSLQAGDILDVEILFAHQQGDLNIQLYPEGQVDAPVARSESSSDNERLSHQVEAAGSYRLLVSGSPGSRNSYRLRATVGSIHCQDECPEEGRRRCEDDGYQVCGADHDGDDCLEWGPVISCHGNFCHHGQCVEDCTDDFEPNDSQDSAAGLEPGSASGLFICPDDIDWYRIDLEAGARLVASIEFTHADGDLDMELFDADSGRLGSSASTSDREEVHHTAAAAGAFYVKVYGYNGAQNLYSLSVVVEGGDPDTCQDECPAGGQRRCQDGGYQVCGDHDEDACLEWGPVTSCPEDQVCQDGECLEEEDNGCVDDEFEDNDSSDAAANLDVTLGYASFPDLRICSDDEDWYAIELDYGNLIRIEARFQHAGGDLDMELVHPGQGTVATGDSSDDDESIQYISGDVGVFYLKVYGHLGAQNDYDLEITVE